MKIGTNPRASPPNIKIGAENTARNPAKSDFCEVSIFLVRSGPFLASWRPGNRLKSFLEATRFDSTVYEPVATLKTSNRINFHVAFRPQLLVQLPTNKHFSKRSISYWPPAPATMIKTTVNGFSSCELFLKTITFFHVLQWTSQLFMKRTFLLLGF